MKKLLLAALTLMVSHTFLYAGPAIPASNGNPPPITGLANLHTSDLLKRYMQLTGRTVLRTELPDVSFTLATLSTNQADIVMAVTNALKEKGISVIPDGEKFAKVLPDSNLSACLSRSSWLKTPPAKPGRTGEVSFPAAPLEMILPIYAEMVGAKSIDHDENYHFPPITISLVTQKPLTKEEAIYALDTLFSWNGFKLVPSKDQHLKVVWLQTP